MDDEGKAVHALEAVGVEDARLNVERGQDVEVVVFQHVLWRFVQRGEDHGVEQVGADDVAVQYGRTVHHHVHAFVLEFGQALVTEAGSDDGLARQFLQAELVEFMGGGYQHGGLLQCAPQYEASPFLHRTGAELGRQAPVLDVMRTSGIGLQSVQ